mgnify:CR=1 FL=1
MNINISNKIVFETRHKLQILNELGMNVKNHRKCEWKIQFWIGGSKERKKNYWTFHFLCIHSLVVLQIARAIFIFLLWLQPMLLLLLLLWKSRKSFFSLASSSSTYKLTFFMLLSRNTTCGAKTKRKSSWFWFHSPYFFFRFCLYPLVFYFFRLFGPFENSRVRFFFSFRALSLTRQNIFILVIKRIATSKERNEGSRREWETHKFNFAKLK